MAERKAVNKYYPPDWTPSKGSINKYVGQHPLRERAKKLGQGILVIRFELPYNIWCGGCGAHVGMGVRYNAEKKKVGNYYSTPIYRFRMKCHLCDNYFEIETDPKNCDYNVVSGARRKNERWSPSATETVETTDKEDAKRMAIDAMFKLEHGVEDVQKSKKVAPVLHQLQDVQSVWKDDYSANKLLRKKFREEKKSIKLQEEKDEKLRQKASLDIPLVPEEHEDVEKAKKIKFYNSGFDAHKNKSRKEISTRSWFNSGTTNLTSTKIPGLSLRKRKRSFTDEKDEWKNSVKTKAQHKKDSGPYQVEMNQSCSSETNTSPTPKDLGLSESTIMEDKCSGINTSPNKPVIPDTQTVCEPVSLVSNLYSDSGSSDDDVKGS